jgi:hypothetical protein
MADTKHQWQFLAIYDGTNPRVVVVCSACGAARSSIVPQAANLERHVGLGGKCPGEPQPQDTGSVARS